MGNRLSLRNNTSRMASEVWIQDSDHQHRLYPGESLYSTHNSLMHVYPDNKEARINIARFNMPVKVIVVRNGRVALEIPVDLANFPLDIVINDEDVRRASECRGNLCRPRADSQRFAYHDALRSDALQYPDPYPRGQQTGYINTNPQGGYESHQRDPEFTTGQSVNAMAGGDHPFPLMERL